MKFSKWQECVNLVEVRCLMQLAHPNIVTLYNLTLENNILYLIFEWMECYLSEIPSEIRAGRFQRRKCAALCYASSFSKRSLVCTTKGIATEI